MFCLFCIQWVKSLLKIHVAPFMQKSLLTVQRYNKAAEEMPETMIRTRDFLCDPDQVSQGAFICLQTRQLHTWSVFTLKGKNSSSIRGYYSYPK